MGGLRSVAVLAVLVAGACSSSSGSPHVSGNGGLSPKDIAETAVSSLGSASSFHEFGTVHDNSGRLVHLDASVARDAGRAKVVVAGRVVQLRTVNGKTYFQANDAFWRSRVRPDQRAKLVPALRGKWVHVQRNDPNFGGFVQLISRTDIVNSLKGVSNGSYSAGPRDVVRGIDTVSAMDDQDGTIVFVPQTGKPYPVEIQNGGNTLDFDSWNKPVVVTQPPAGKVIEASKLGG